MIESKFKNYKEEKGLKNSPFFLTQPGNIFKFEIMDKKLEVSPLIFLKKN